MPTIEERSRYQSDFGVSWLRLPALFFGALLAAGVVALCLKLAFAVGLYVVILLAMGGGAALAAVLYGLVAWTNCRNQWLAGSIGALSGLIAYLGYYHFCLLDALPPGNAGRVDLLPKYIAFRMQTDVLKDMFQPDRNQQGKKPLTPLNYWDFACELSLLIGVAAVFAWKRASRAYCPEEDQWMRQEKALLPPFSSADLYAALDNNELLPQFVAYKFTGSAHQAARLTLEYAVPKTGSPLEFPIYASFEDFPVPRPWYWPASARRMLLRQVELELDDVLALRPLFPKLTRLLETQHSELPELPVEAPLPSAPLVVSDQARITPVPERYRQRVLGKGYNLLVNLFGISPSAYRLRLGREIDQRPKLLVDPQDPASIFVSLVPRERFTDRGFKWMWASDLLFLKLDKTRRQLLMEGDMARYRIPFGAIAVCKPECFFNPYDRLHQTPLWMVRLKVCVEEGWQELLLSVNHTRHGRVDQASRQQVVEDLCRRIVKLCGQDAH